MFCHFLPLKKMVPPLHICPPPDLDTIRELLRQAQRRGERKQGKERGCRRPCGRFLSCRPSGTSTCRPSIGSLLAATSLRLLDSSACARESAGCRQLRFEMRRSCITDTQTCVFQKCFGSLYFGVSSTTSLPAGRKFAARTSPALPGLFGKKRGLTNGWGSLRESHGRFQKCVRSLRVL